MADGLIIYFDGPDGAGKSTQLELAASALRQAGHKVHTTRTMGGTPIGELLRQVALSDTPRPVETDLYIALACQYALATDILPRREAGEIVLVDRSPLSIIAYQVTAGGLDRELGFEAVGQLMSHIEPDLTIIYEVASEELHHRRQQRNQAPDYFEAKPPEFHQKVSQGFAETAAFGRALVDANDSVEAVHAATMELIQKRLQA